MDNKNLIGRKIKELRKRKKITQAELAGEEFTRNLLSQIENGVAAPSLSTLEYIAKKLEIPVSYLLTEDDDILYYEKKEAIKKIHSAFSEKNYASCVYIIGTLSGIDSELAYILTVSHFEIGKKALSRGSLHTAHKNFNLATEYSRKTVYDTAQITSVIPMYSAVVQNIQSPLLEFDTDEYQKSLNNTLDYEFYKYLTLDFSYPYKTDGYRLHSEAKLLLKNRKYSEAVPILLAAADAAKKDGYNAFLIFGVYTDLELCYKELYDFENAYLYSSKRMSLIEGFKS